jgi:hypothetical protein
METNDPNDDAIRAGETGGLRNIGKRTQRAEPQVTSSQYPVATSCPHCGCKEFRRVKVNRPVAFTDDRECAACGSRYTPPTPAWAAVVFILLGVLITAGGATGVGFYLFLVEKGLIGGIHLGVSTAVTGIGLTCTVFGIRSLKSRDVPGKNNGPTE